MFGIFVYCASMVDLNRLLLAVKIIVVISRIFTLTLPPDFIRDPARSRDSPLKGEGNNIGELNAVSSRLQFILSLC